MSLTSPANSMGFSLPGIPLETRTLAAQAGAGRKGAPDAAPLSAAEEAKRETQQSFASLLSQSVAARTGSKSVREMSPAELDKQARQAAEDFVAVAFVQPIFKNLRGSHIGGELPPPLGPGPGEKQFRSLADSQVARQLVHASRWPLVDNLAKRLRTAKVAGPYTQQGLATAPVLPGSPADLKRREAERAAKAAAELTQPAAASAVASKSSSTPSRLPAPRAKP